MATNITAAQVKSLRDSTGAGMMECKKALIATEGDHKKAVVWLRERGIARAAGKAGRTAAEGTVAMSTSKNAGAILELNCETDFSGRNEEFVSAASSLADLALKHGCNNVADLLSLSYNGGTVAEYLQALSAKIGENIQLRRIAYLSAEGGLVVAYNHMKGKIGVLVAVDSDDDENFDLARDIGMHVAASSPKYLSRDEVQADELQQESDIIKARLEKMGKPAAVIEKATLGQLNKFYAEVCLLEQVFVKDSAKTVEAHVKTTSPGTKVSGFVRFQLGEGVEVEESNFAAEVEAQLKKS